MNIPLAIASLCADCDNIVVAHGEDCPSCAARGSLQRLSELVPTLGPVELRYSPATVREWDPYRCGICRQPKAWNEISGAGVCMSCLRNRYRQPQEVNA